MFLLPVIEKRTLSDAQPIPESDVNNEGADHRLELEIVDIKIHESSDDDDEDFWKIVF